jgi:hypothetical protein
MRLLYQVPCHYHSALTDAKNWALIIKRQRKIRKQRKKKGKNDQEYLKISGQKSDSDGEIRFTATRVIWRTG